jgi:hypothetical protein
MYFNGECYEDELFYTCGESFDAGREICLLCSCYEKCLEKWD